MGDDNMTSWWTPTGWAWAKAPKNYQTMIDNPSETDWSSELRCAGYVDKYQTESRLEGNRYEFDVWQHYKPDIHLHPGLEVHLYVGIGDAHGGLSEFFVRAEHIAPFWCDKFPELIRAEHESNRPDLAKAIVAWVRHGHGEAVIDQWGEENHEERVLRMDQERAHHQQRAEKQAAKKVSAQ